ncbi:ribonuclease P protein component [Thiotrichales bacterium 19S9-12]|nr:ribonuclease P protein component [Thiotrichales bacterium 19S9-11]MCF6810892.1 ribonuclease P protein component [Thiotrichales bacterium 19S9-12]
MLPKTYRFDKEDFSIVFNSNQTKRVSTRFFTLLYLEDSVLTNPKVGVILAKKKQKKAIERNLTKRIIHAFIKDRKAQLKLVRMLYISNKDIKNANRESIWDDLEKSFKQLKL